MAPAVKSLATCEAAWNGLKLRMNAASPDPVATTQGWAVWAVDPPEAPVVAIAATPTKTTATLARMLRRRPFMRPSSPFLSRP